MDSFRLTKIVATIGPASESEEIIEKLILAGVNIFRFNFKHNSPEWHRKTIKKVRRIAEKLQRPIGILLDLQGEEIRMNLLKEYYEIKEGDVLYYVEQGDKRDFKGKGFYFSHPKVLESLKEGEEILVDDGKFRFVFQKVNGKAALISESSGILGDRKTVNIPGSDFTFDKIIERDIEGLKIAAEEKVDFLAISFVKFAEDIKRMMKELKKFGGSSYPISKVETRAAIDRFEEILKESFGVMVARGDMAVETSMEEMPYFQKQLVEECIKKAKPVITATQMLESMTQNFFPTRAEISDVANAVYDLTDAVMLSNETAVGKYPVRTVEVMSKILAFNEKKNKVDSRARFNFELSDQEEIIVDSAYGLEYRFRGQKDGIKAFVVFTHTGRTARLLSRYRPLVPIYAFTPSERVVGGLTISFGVEPFLYPSLGERRSIRDEDVAGVLKFLIEKGKLSSGDRVVVLHGDILAVEGGTSTVRIVKA